MLISDEQAHIFHWWHSGKVGFSLIRENCLLKTEGSKFGNNLIQICELISTFCIIFVMSKPNTIGWGKHGYCTIPLTITNMKTRMFSFVQNIFSSYRESRKSASKHNHFRREMKCAFKNVLSFSCWVSLLALSLFVVCLFGVFFPLWKH